MRATYYHSVRKRPKADIENCLLRFDDYFFGYQNSNLSMDNDGTFEARLSLANDGNENTNDMIYVSWCYLYGDGVEQSIEMGVRWLEKAAQSGSAEAMVRLAELYEVGNILPLDCEMAHLFYRKAMSAGGFHAHYAKGVAHYFGSQCVPQDKQLACHHFSLAADAGHLVSKIQMARLKRSGLFGAREKVKGYFVGASALIETWYLILSGQSNDRLWDAQRWLKPTPFGDRIRKGTRFE